MQFVKQKLELTNAVRKTKPPRYTNAVRKTKNLKFSLQIARKW